MRDAVLGAAMGYTAAQVVPFLNSLRATGFAGDVVLLVLPTLGADDRAALRAAGARLLFVHRELTRLPAEWAERRLTHRLLFVHRRLGPLLAGLPGRVGRRLTECYAAALLHPASYRFAYFQWWLELRQGDYRRVLFADTRDVVFQADPLADPLPGPLVCALDPARWTMTSCQSNRLWAIEFLGRAEYDRIADRRVSCCGTTFGTAAAMLHYLRAMTAGMVREMDRTLNRFGPDQSVHNHLLWTGGLPGAVTAENGGRLVFTARGEDMGRFRVADGVLLADDGRPVAVVHQYDRVPELANLRAARTAGQQTGGRGR